MNKTLDLKNVIISKLPKKFKTTLSLDLRGTDIKELPNELIVGGDLFLNEFIDKLPEKLIVGGDLIILNESIKSISYLHIICGNVIGKEVNYIKPKYSLNTVYNNIVCCSDGTIVPFSNFYIHKREVHNEKYFFDRKPINFYYGVKENLCAATFDNGRISVAGKSFKDCEKKIELLLLKEKKDSFKKFSHWTLNTLHSPLELKDFFVLTTNACEIGCDEFIHTYAEPNKKYSLKDLKDFLFKYVPNFPYLYLFLEKYKEFEYNKNLITLS